MYYIYAYLREDGSPYYIGKGKEKRAWHKGHKVPVPKESNRIVIMESNLTEIGAFALERFYIRWYGKKCDNTGILRNIADGGEGGNTGITEEARKRLSEARKDVPKSESWKQNMRGKRPKVNQTGSKNNNAKSVYTPYGEFACLRDASKVLNIDYDILWYKLNKQVNKQGWGYL